MANGGLTLENAQVAVATLNPFKAFGPSTFGPLKFRVSLKGVAGDWQPLANLVRLPVLTELKCPTSTELACQLTGTYLFLIDSVSGDPQFTHPVAVPDGFLGTALPVPHPSAGSLYIKLRDNPEIVNPALLAIQTLPGPLDDNGRSAERRSAATANPGDSATATALPTTAAGTQAATPQTPAPSASLPAAPASPTAAVPTAASPTAAVPTAAVPTAAVPTAAVPTAAVPSTAAPSAAVPTAAVPSAAVPTAPVQAAADPSPSRPQAAETPATAAPAKPSVPIPVLNSAPRAQTAP
jgi:hypothetical protein